MYTPAAFAQVADDVVLGLLRASGFGHLVTEGSDTPLVSPRWYPSKLEHGKVVPTWNYEVAHVHATVDVIHDLAWLHMMLDRLSAQNEGNVSAVDGEPEWEVGDAPAEFIAKPNTLVSDTKVFKSG